MLNLKGLSRAEKLRIMEALWDDLTHDEVPLPSPAWHGDALRAAEQAKGSGEAAFLDWESAKQALRDAAR